MYRGLIKTLGRYTSASLAFHEMMCVGTKAMKRHTRPCDDDTENPDSNTEANSIENHDADVVSAASLGENDLKHSRRDEPTVAEQSTSRSSSEAGLPSPYTKHDYAQWKDSDWAVLHENSQELYYYHYQLHVQGLGWGTDDWASFRSNFPEQMACLEQFHVQWASHGPPDRPLPMLDDPLMEGGHATAEWLAEATGASGTQSETTATSEATDLTGRDTDASGGEAKLSGRSAEAVEEDQGVAKADELDRKTSCAAPASDCIDVADERPDVPEATHDLVPNQLDHGNEVADTCNIRDDGDDANMAKCDEDVPDVSDDDVTVIACKDPSDPSDATSAAEESKVPCGEDRPTLASMAGARGNITTCFLHTCVILSETVCGRLGLRLPAIAAIRGATFRDTALGCSHRPAEHLHHP